MTISTTTSAVTIQGNNATTVFNFPFTAGDAAWISVTYTAANGVVSELTRGTDYTLYINPPASGAIWGVGGSVTYAPGGNPIATSTAITIQRVVPDTQLVVIRNQGDFYATSVEQALDVLCMQQQQTATQTNQALTYSIEDPGPFYSLPPGVSARAGYILGFSSTGALSLYQQIPPGSVISSAMAPVVAASSIAEAVALLGINISLAMEPICAAATVADAVALMGLKYGNIIPCTATVVGTAITLTRATGTNAAAESFGYYLGFQLPAGPYSGPFSVSESSDSLAGATLYDQSGTDVLSLLAYQYCVIAWSPTFNGWALINPYSPNQARFAQFTSNGTWVAPTGVTIAYVSLCAGGGGGGGGSAGHSGGGGGGGSQAYQKAPYSVTPFGTYTIHIGAGGAGGSGGDGSPGTASYILTPLSGTLVSASPGLGGSYGSTTGTIAGGAAGGAGGLAGSVGSYAGTLTGIGWPGSGGGCLFGAGGESTPAHANGNTPGQYGGGGSGAAGASSVGGSGAPGYALLEW